MADNLNDLATRARTEITGMAKEGFANPSTKPVLTAAAIGAVAGLVLPIVSLPVGALAGAAFGLWQRIKK
ncbi:hypothetical protein [Novosphingobium sp. FKTRR1]|uniref:hypothetical protein n=1 Tax=unclassified Novosphingobium TaxID=2644732 RepID=UPI001CF06593|nr:hypothetical protein [Novosphingobium sp. FKTRR1]